MTPLEVALVRAAALEQRLADIDAIYHSTPQTMSAATAIAALNAIGRIAHDPA